jgi:hypothetical protein
MRFLLLLFLLSGCAVEHGKVYVKDGKQYGVKPGLTWRGRWWDHYQRGTSYAEGAFWADAVADFQAAIRQRQADQRTARTYGFHFLDYFPHRELGIAYYQLGRHDEASAELATSLQTVDSARAKFYLNKARQAQLRRTGQDTSPPRIVIDSLSDGLLTRRLTLTVTGWVEDDSYVAAVSVHHQAQFIELAQPRLPFAQEVALQEGTNSIDIVAADLFGRLSSQRLSVSADRQGPLVSVEGVEVSAALPVRQARVRGVMADQSPLRRALVAGQPLPVPPQTEWEFSAELALTPGMDRIPFEVEDLAGNVTRGEIPLTLPADGLPPERKGTLEWSPLTRWATLEAGTVMADLPSWQVAQRPPGQAVDRQPPVIRLKDLAPQQTVYYDTVYLEGRVTDSSPIVALTLNGEPFVIRRHGQQLFFSRLVALQVGENRLLLEAMDSAGNTAQQEVVVVRQEQVVRQLSARLRVAILPTVMKGEAPVLSDAVDEHLLAAFVRQGRFQLVERERLEALLREKLLSQSTVVDPDTAVRLGKIVAAEVVLIPTINETPQSLEVFARVVDAESGTIMAAEDVYGETTVAFDLRTLMTGLAWKLRQHFPLLEGLVVKRDGQRVVIDRGKKHALTEHMKTILFRAGEELIHPITGKTLGHSTETLGEARVEVVADESSQATLLESAQAHTVKQLDQFITK